jgi:hypothetical protein
MPKTYTDLQIIKTIDLPKEFYSGNDISYVSVKDFQMFLESNIGKIIKFKPKNIFHNYLKYDLKDLLFTNLCIKVIKENDVSHDGFTYWEISNNAEFV